MINLKSPILNEKGEQVKVISYEPSEVGEEKKQKKIVLIDLYQLVRDALISHNGETDRNVIERRYDLFMTVLDKEEIELSEDDRNFILELICNKYEVFHAGQAIKLLK